MSNERPMSCDDEEHLAKIIVESLREARKWHEEDEDTTNFPEAFRALDRAELAAQELGDRIWRLRGTLDAIVARASEIPGELDHDYHVAMEIFMVWPDHVLGWMDFRTSALGPWVYASDGDTRRPILLGRAVRIVGRQQRQQGP